MWYIPYGYKSVIFFQNLLLLKLKSYQTVKKWKNMQREKVKSLKLLKKENDY